MTNYTTNISVLKRAIVNFSEKLTNGTARPFHKFFADVCFGAMSSKSCIITDIARVLQEKTQIINTVERLTGHLIHLV